MKALHLHESATAQWHSLVYEAENHCHTHLGEELESYLVFLLMRYSSASKLAESIIALEFLSAMERGGNTRSDSLRDVGDKCLLFSGLFPSYAEKRHVRISYYVDLGIGAYVALADVLTGSRAMMFMQLAKQFIGLMTVLQATRTLETDQPALQPLQAFELWQDTDSQYALATLSRYIHPTSLPVKPQHEYDPTTPHYKVVSKNHGN